MTKIRYCCEDVSLIENYELAKTDTTAKIGKHWFNDGVKNIMTKECPKGFVPGRLKK